MKRKLNFGRLESKLLVILAFLFCWIFLQSCNKDSSVSDSVTLSVKLIGVSSDDQSLGDNGVAKTASVYAYQTVSQINDVQFASSPFSDRYDFNLTVAKDQFAEIAGKETLSLLGKNVSTNLAATLSPLGTNVHYRMVIYKHDNPSNSSSDATYVADYEYTAVGAVGGNPSFYLNDGEYYTFIFYSTNQTATQSINASQKLNSATLPNLVGDQNFMYQRITRLLSKGDNVLEVELVHKFTEVTINLDASDISGTIESIGTITLPHYAQANANLLQGRFRMWEQRQQKLFLLL
ncbi:hypothetical protein [Sphingobacterium hungaricum]|uniref:Uncharacterized protein n=1 Tax=Sphingobacterium hungaricum TaxID=2082723 RepID=A0A928V0N6_9SPHI|nr:hypothetical protein [Sphingobacterium hungaricum]MBE8714519.1 hypothetical protein [Sphingobacterium hungaricum]